VPIRCQEVAFSYRKSASLAWHTSIGHPITSARAVRLRVCFTLTGACGYHCISLPSLRLTTVTIATTDSQCDRQPRSTNYRADPWVLLDFRYPYSYYGYHALRLLLLPVQGMEMPRGAGPDTTAPRFGYAGTGKPRQRQSEFHGRPRACMHACRNPRP
jgi:hypothetical protein